MSGLGNSVVNINQGREPRPKAGFAVLGSQGGVLMLWDFNKYLVPKYRGLPLLSFCLLPFAFYL